MVLRDDLPVGVIAAQTIHAAGASGAINPPDPGTHAIALAAPACELAWLERVLIAHAIPHVAVREPDAPYHGDLVAIGLAPAPRRRVAAYVRHLVLVGRRGPKHHLCQEISPCSIPSSR